MTPALPALLLILGLGTAAAQPVDDGRAVYRCGNGSYSSTPCPGGRMLDASDPRSAEQQRQAREAAARDARMADQLAAERRAREQAVVGQRAGNLGPATPPAPAASKLDKARGKKTQHKPKSGRSAAQAPAMRP